MMVSRICKCGGEVFFDLEGKGLTTPSDIYPIGEVVNEMMGGIEVPIKLFEEVLEEVLGWKDFKKLRFFQKCPGCGGENVYILWTPLN